jgi:hypothetical protein
MTTIALSLDALKLCVTAAIESDAMLIFWHHKMGQFRHMIGSDQGHFRQELKSLRRQYRALNIVLITAGETLNVNGTDLYTMELEIKNLPCHAYMLLREQGDFGDAAKTPYLFRSRETRDKTIRYLMKPKRSNDGIESNCD